MRRFMLPVIALSLAAAPAVVDAQTPRERGAMAGPRLMSAGNPAARVLQHREALGLSASQVQQLEQLQQQIEQRDQPLRQQLQAVRPLRSVARGGTARGPEQREQMRARMQERQARLTPEQREEIEARREQLRDATPEQRAELRAQMQERMKQRREQLTAEQRERLEQRRAELPAMRRMTAEQRAQVEALRPVLEQLRASREQARHEVEAVLSAEQQTQLRALMQQRATELRERRGTPSERPTPGAPRGATRS